MDVTQLGLLTWVGWPNGEELESTCVQINFVLEQSERRTSQINETARKAWPKGVPNIL